MITANDIRSIITATTKKWTKQRKAEERGWRSRRSRKDVYSRQVDFTEVAPQVLPDAYAHASGNGKYTVDKRQLYYAAREPFRILTGREITVDYLTQTLLVQYINRYPEETADWKITASPRGTLIIPNTGYDLQIPCGTIAIEEYLEEARQPVELFRDLAATVQVQFPSIAEGKRYQGVFYIEKEGFGPQLREARIAEKFDLAVISCKGQSVVAARRFVDEVCRIMRGVPLYIAHDFDKDGFLIAQRLTTVSDAAREKEIVKYEFENEINAIDLGLRLEDVRKYNLAEEHCRFRGDFPPDTITTAEERDFLRSGLRVELNAFTAPQFIEWLETKLTEQGLDERLIPADDVLEDAYRRGVAITHINAVIRSARANAKRMAEEATIPQSLKHRLRQAMEESPDDAWDVALYHLIEERLARSDG